jgi:hypothetical protein
MLASEKLKTRIKSKYIYLDNDFLGYLFNNKESLYDFSQLIDESVVILTGITKFEFLRDISDPGVRIKKEEFVIQDLFKPEADHNDLYLKIHQNALIISRIYAQEGLSKGVSSDDLLIAGDLMFRYSNGVLITGNKKHFPSVLFDAIGTISFEDKKKQEWRTFWAIGFNKEKFDESNTSIETQYLEEKTKLLKS